MRRIVTVEHQVAGGSGEPPDDFAGRIVKYIPADIVGAWIAITGLVNAEETKKYTALWVAFGVMVVITFFWMKRQTTLPGKPPAWTQVLVATAAFVIWVYALGGPFKGPGLDGVYEPAYGSVALIVSTLGAGLIVPKQ